MRRKAQTEGCIAALSYRYPSKSDRPLPSIRRGRCWHRPGNLAMPQGFPAGVNACREDLRHPGRVLARQGAAPLRRLGRHLPLQGRLYRRQSPQSLPCKGRWMRRKAQTEGCIAALRRKYPVKPGRALPRVRRERCWHRPGNLALPKGPRRRAKSPALQSRRRRAATHKRQPSARPAGGPMQASAPTQRCGGLPLPVPLPRVRHMVGRAISPAADPSAAANLSGGRERPPYKTGQTGIRTGNGRHRLGQTQGKPLPKCPRRSPPFCAAAPFYGILKVRTCQKYPYPI